MKALVWNAVCQGALGLLLFVAVAEAEQPGAYPPAPLPLEYADPAEELPKPAPSADADEPADDVLDMDLDQLAQADVVVAPAMDLEVTSVSRQESTVGRSPAAVFVITQEMIGRSGARTVPDLLRMVPGAEVARIDANKWAISIRGFNNRFGNKLLVQIDGRSVYTQAFNGVFWDEHEVVLEDVERIEVIRGPGATVWGANAVNGIINIITKSAQDTQGLLVSGGTGTEERGFGTVRYGGQSGDDLYWRAYGKHFERDGGGFPGDDQFDDWRQGRGGFRADWLPSPSDSVMVQANYFESDLGSALNDVSLTPPFPATESLYDRKTRNQNYIFRWSRVLDDDTNWQIQTYYDDVERHDPFIIDEQRTFDLDLQYRFPLGHRHNVICGAGYRHVRDHIEFAQSTSDIAPNARSTDLYSYFIQDEITLEEDRWYLTVGSKFEHNDFSGFEYQPSIRLLHLPSERESIWAAVSRAVRTPGRVEEDATFTFPVLDPTLGPLFFQSFGNDDLEAEDVLAVEMGYRAQPTDEFSWDLALFYNRYEDLVGIAPSGAPFFDVGLGGLVFPSTFANVTSADTYGAELASTYQVNPNWQLTGAYSLLYMNLHSATDFDTTEGSSPHNRFYLRSGWTPWCDWEFDVTGRYVDNLPVQGIPSYFTMDVRLAWRPHRDLEWAVVGRNLVDSPHPEFPDAFSGFATQVQPEVFTVLTRTY
jgi:iron complex outermembrane receptor protein